MAINEAAMPELPDLQVDGAAWLEMEARGQGPLPVVGQLVMGGVQLSRDSAVRLQIHLAAQLHPQRLILLFL